MNETNDVQLLNANTCTLPTVTDHSIGGSTDSIIIIIIILIIIIIIIIYMMIITNDYCKSVVVDFNAGVKYAMCK